MAANRNHLVLTKIKPCCPPDCPNRKYDCHGKCETYLKYRAECDEQIRLRKLEYEVTNAIGDAMKRIPGKRGI